MRGISRNDRFASEPEILTPRTERYPSSIPNQLASESLRKSDFCVQPTRTHPCQPNVDVAKRMWHPPLGPQQRAERRLHADRTESGARRADAEHGGEESVVRMGGPRMGV